MVIIRTSATEVSIQAVSPEFGVHFSSTAFFGSGSAAQAGASADASAGAAAAGAAAEGAAISAYERLTVPMLSERPRSAATARPMSPARKGFLNVIVVSSCPQTFGVGSEGGDIGFAGADAHGVLERNDEDLA